MDAGDIFPILEAGSAEGDARLADLSGRTGRLEDLASRAAREKTLAVFGEPLGPREVVARIVKDVRERGDKAVCDLARRLDGVSIRPGDLRIPEAELDRALEEAPEAFLGAARFAAGNIRAYQQRLMPADVALEETDGLRLGARWGPVESAACYIPGGIASYPSSVLMNAIPAQVAGVGRIVLAVPPGKEGAGNPLTLAAAALVGCREVYRVGGAVAIAALAFGTGTIRRVECIVGPGNLFVMLAKREVFGAVGIDMFAGPSEVLVLADESADPELAAADLLSQAEHDPMASAILVTPSRGLAARVRQALVRQLALNPRRDVAAESLGHYGLALVVEDMDAGCAAANAIAPEHLELLCEDPEARSAKIRHAGAIFLGPWAPEPLGDYAAGPSHTLPTGGTARFMSGLSPLSFMKRTSLIGASREGFERALGAIDELARADGLPGHAASAGKRFGR